VDLRDTELAADPRLRQLGEEAELEDAALARIEHPKRPLERRAVLAELESRLEHSGERGGVFLPVGRQRLDGGRADGLRPALAARHPDRRDAVAQVPLDLAGDGRDRERRQVLSAIGPFWDGNEVWLLAAGGVLFLAFPRVRRPLRPRWWRRFLGWIRYGSVAVARPR